MREQYAMNKQKPASTVVQTYNGHDLFASTQLVQFWMSIGMTVSNITRFVQYKPGAALEPFVSKVTEGRIAATYEDDEAKSNTFKLFGNGGKYTH